MRLTNGELLVPSAVEDYLGHRSPLVGGWLEPHHGALLGGLGLAPIALGPDEPAPDVPAAVTMSFVVTGLCTALAAFVLRKLVQHHRSDRPLRRPGNPHRRRRCGGALATERAPLQRMLLTTDVTGVEWLVCLDLSLAFRTCRRCREGLGSEGGKHRV